MFFEYFTSLNNIKIEKNCGFNHAVVNGTGHIYGFKYCCFSDTSIATKSLSKIFEESGLEELSFFIVKSQTSFEDSKNSERILKCNNYTNFSGRVIESVNNKIHNRLFPSKYYYESIYVCSNQELDANIFSKLISQLSKKGLVLTGLDQEELLSQIETWTGDLKSKFSERKGSFGEVSFKYKIKNAVISSPLLELHEHPSTQLNHDLDYSNVDYKLVTCCYFFKIEDSIFTKLFYGLRLYSNLQKIIEPYQNINNFINNLASLKVRFSIASDSHKTYLAMIPGVFHIDNYFIKSAIKKFPNNLNADLMISQNDFQSSEYDSDSIPLGDYSYPIETNNHELEYIDFTSKNLALCGTRDDYYKSFIVQYSACAIDSGESVIIIDTTDDMNFFPHLFGGDMSSSLISHKKDLLAGFNNVSDEVVKHELLDFFGFNSSDSINLVSSKDKPLNSNFSFSNKGKIKLFRPTSLKEYIQCMLILIEASKYDSYKVVLANSDDVYGSFFFEYFLKNISKNGSSILCCLGSSRLFDEKRINQLDIFDDVFSRKELIVKSSYKPFQILDLMYQDDNEKAWFGIMNKKGNLIVNLPVVRNYACIFNTSLQSEHMVTRMIEGGARPETVFDKLSMIS